LSREAQEVGHLARFQLLRELGRGAQARVWLAHDPRLDREVALKLLDPAVGADAVSLWLDEARAVSRLSHPNIVPVFEADEVDGQPYLVFEYVPGPTLAQARRGKPGLPAREAGAIMLGVLDGLAAAHDQGVVHRDLKPSNILLGTDGRARVMDFGIAARRSRPGADDALQGRIVGTPGYISPEAAAGLPPLPAMDVFAAGVMLGELLGGQPLMQESDPYRAVERVRTEDLVLPAQVVVDDILRGIVQRALSRDLHTRYDSARSMHTALSSWMKPLVAPVATPTDHSTLEFLLRRMRHKSDFPALSAAVGRIQRMAVSDKETLGSLSEEILKDVALTNKLLRMVNTAHFTAVAGGGIHTVSRAVALVGFAGIRNMATSVVLLEHMNDKAHAAQLRDEFLRALMAGTVASELAQRSRVQEEAFLCALFQNLGRLLAEYYLPEEALQIREQVGPQMNTPEEAAAREVAAWRVLGMGLQELGQGVAKAWGLPDKMQRALKAPMSEVPGRAAGRGAARGADPDIEQLRWLARSANAMVDAVRSHEGAAQTEALLRTAGLYAPAIGLTVQDVLGATQSARMQLTDLAKALGLGLAPGALSRRLLQTDPAAPAATSILDATADMAQTEALLGAALDAARLAAVTRSLGVNELLHLVLDAIHTALHARCVVLCLRDPASGLLLGRVGLGVGGAEASAAFRIAPDAPSSGDVFSALCAKGADLLVADSRTVASRLPVWFRQRVNAPTFLLLPMMLKGSPIGLIYVDKGDAGSLVLEEPQLVLLRGLRDQAAQALGAASGRNRRA
jgi:serine/threonine protein kinase